MASPAWGYLQHVDMAACFRHSTQRAKPRTQLQKKKYVDTGAHTEVNACKLEKFLKDSTSLEELANTDPKHPAVAGGLQTKQKIAEMDCYLLDGQPRNGAHSPLFVVVNGPERRAQHSFQRRLEEKTNRVWHQRKAQGRGSTWSGWSGSWGSSGK